MAVMDDAFFIETERGNIFARPLIFLCEPSARVLGGGEDTVSTGLLASFVTLPARARLNAIAPA